jgi:hypothetical protein
LSTPYVHENTYLTGFSGEFKWCRLPWCVLLLMPTTGKVETNHLKYGSTYSDEVAKRLITVLKLINTISKPSLQLQNVLV